ncbi:MAG TPA: DUF1553 domain-containing protein [Fimbriimonas sp.]|nr:DUF1553 domain-containing protein [Fimbriimonas sp.]
MKLSTSFGFASIAVFGVAILTPPQRAQKAPAAKVSFGRDIRPILSEHCFKCHGPDAATAAAGLRLDTPEGAKSALGPKDSRLLARALHTDPEMRMPPPNSGVKPLTQHQKDLLKAWIAQGATYEKHWSFVTPKMPPIPLASNPNWPKNPIDNFVLANLQSNNLQPEKEADKDTLALRAAQTLTGLPPTLEELNQFRQDTQPGAYERYVDRLLAKPEYGEHQARYWLDAVRYGDTHGLQLDNERGIYPYRDWVIRAFNSDLPFNQFVKWQLAGDLLPNPTIQQQVATGYVRLNLTTNEGGAIPEEFLARNTFDRVDTTSTVMLGLTVACAKCHDHKYDPISQADYYSLYAYFNSTEDEPLDGNITFPPPVIRAATPEQERQLRALATQLKQTRDTVDVQAATSWLQKNRQPVPTVTNWQISPTYTAENYDKAYDKAEPGEPGAAQPQWKPFKYELGKNADNIIAKDASFVYIRANINLTQSRNILMRVRSDDAVKVWVNGKLVHANKVTRGVVTAEDLVTTLFSSGDNEVIFKIVNGAGPDGFGLAFSEPHEQRLDNALARLKMKPGDSEAEQEIQEIFLEFGPKSEASERFATLKKQQKDFEATLPLTLVAKERSKARMTHILKRGEYNQLGAPVTRKIPTALGVLPKGETNNRLTLANWLVDPANPLLTRVFVNRLWQQHFGNGIVKTVEDFGNQGEWPTNQPLLDYLAVNLIKNGWSIKQLNRQIVTSAAFRQSSRIDKTKLAKDPENRLVSRGPRFRLDAEVIRDKSLTAGGLLVQKQGGRGFKPYQPDGLWESSSDPASSTHFYVRDKGLEIYRRSVYQFWKRTSPPPMLVTFDAPLRDTCVVKRSATNTPLQALASLNETAFLESHRAAAVRILNTAKNQEARIQTAFTVLLGRNPRPEEAALIAKAVARYQKRFEDDPASATKLLNVGDAPQDKTHPITEQATWMIVCSSLMNTDEFLTQH